MSCLWTVCAIRRRQQEQTDNGARNAATTATQVRTRAITKGASARIAPKTRVAVCQVFWLARSALCYCHAKGWSLASDFVAHYWAAQSVGVSSVFHQW